MYNAQDMETVSVDGKMDTDVMSLESDSVFKPRDGGVADVSGAENAHKSGSLKAGAPP